MKFLLSVLFLVFLFTNDPCFAGDQASVTRFSASHTSNGELALAPDGTVWFADKDGSLFSFDCGTTKIQKLSSLPGAYSCSPFFINKSSNFKAILAGDDGWLNSLSDKGKKIVSTRVDDVFTDKAFPLSQKRFAVVSAGGVPYIFSDEGLPLKSPYLAVQSEQIPQSPATSFSNDTIIHCGYIQNNDTGQPYHRMRLLNIDGSEKILNIPHPVVHCPAIIKSEEGDEAAVLLSTRGDLIIINSDCRFKLPIVRTKYTQAGGSCKIGSAFITSCVDSQTKQNKLISISVSGKIDELMILPELPSSNFLVFNDPKTSRNFIAAGFLDRVVRCIDPEQKNIVKEWTWSDFGAVLYPPVFVNNKLVIYSNSEIFLLKF